MQETSEKGAFMRKIVTGLSCVFLLGLAGLFGYVLGTNRAMNPQIYHANTVGMQIVQMNGLYERMEKSGLDINSERIKYNTDMLTVMDCGQLLKSMALLDANDSRLAPFREGVSLAWNQSRKSGKNPVLCDKDILRWAGE